MEQKFNNDSTENQKVSENPGVDTENVKSEEKEQKKTGRPSIYSDELINAICERVANGEPLRQICREEGMPGWTTVYAWLNTREGLSERFAHARSLGEDCIAQECLDIADNATNDWMEHFDKEGDSTGWKLNGDHVQRSKLRIETRLKLLAKWNPKKWGEKVAIGGADDLPPVRQLSESELEGRIAELTAKLK